MWFVLHLKFGRSCDQSLVEVWSQVGRSSVELCSALGRSLGLCAKVGQGLGDVWSMLGPGLVLLAMFGRGLVKVWLVGCAVREVWSNLLVRVWSKSGRS